MRKATVVYCRFALIATAAFAASFVFADHNLYTKGDAKLDLTGTFIAAGFLNSDPWYGEAESFLGDDTDEWLELGAELGLTFEIPFAGGTLYGAASGVYTDTEGDDASGLTIDRDDNNDFTAEQGYVGFRMTDLFSGLEDDELSISGGAQDYSVGTGMLINDGAGDGGERGGWYLGMRKAFTDTVIVRLKSKQFLAEGFLVENDPRRGGTNGEATGINFEYYVQEFATIGFMYTVVDPNLPDTDDLDIYDLRLEVKPTEGLSFSGEFAHEESDQIDADGYYGQASYQTKALPWEPTFTYRYAHFDGDDPDTADDERFREIAYGYTDYGYWFQGEIAGNYPLGNGNIESHMLRAKAQPNENLTLNVFYYRFLLDQPASLAANVSDDDFGDEVNFTADWQATEHFYVIGVLGVLTAGDAAEQWVGGDDDWLYGMLYVSYSL